MTKTASPQRLCRLADLPDPGARGASLHTPGGVIEDIFVVRRGTQVFAYRNHCPHTGSPLDWQPDQFLNLDRTLIQCATHMALFRIDDGRCVSGPCKGEALTPVALSVVDGWVEIPALALL